MTTVMVVVWLMSSGGMQGEPWQFFDTFAKCQSAFEAVQGNGDRMLFAGGCLDRESLKNHRAFMFELLPVVNAR